MRRLGAVLLIVLLVVGVNVRSVWSGGGKWGSGTPSGARTDAYWLPDGQTPTGKPFPDVAIAGTLVTTSLMSATWSLGISDFLADLSPNTASMSFVGQVSGVPGDDVVISTGLGVQWSGRLDTVTQTRDTAGDWWTTITATDRIGSLGAAQLVGYTIVYDDVEAVAEGIGAELGIPLDVVDNSATGLQVVAAGGNPDGSALAFINSAAKATNVMLTTQRTGQISAVKREGVTPSSVLTLSGVNAPQSWSLATSIDVDINSWSFTFVVTHGAGVYASDDPDIAIYGRRDYDATAMEMEIVDIQNAFFDWYTYGGSQRPTVSGQMIVSNYTQDDLILLDPFQWVTESGTDWQVMSVQHSVTASPYSWTVSITADNLMDLL